MTVNAEITTGDFGLAVDQHEELNINDEIFLHQNEYDLVGHEIMKVDGMRGFDELTSNISSRSSLANLPVGQTTYSTTNTTPEMSSPPKLHPISRGSFSLPIDQLNLLSLKSMSSTQSSKSPSPEYNLYSVIRENPEEEQTINPRQLFTEYIGEAPISAAIPPAPDKPASNGGSDGAPTGNRGYILPSSSSPSLSTLFDGTQRAPYPKAKSHSVSMGSDIPASKKFDFIMNNECFNAILYWINDTLQNVNSKIHDNDQELGGAEEIMVNPTGIMKSNYYKRRNSIQLVTPSSYNQHNSLDDDARVQTKKRRKSYNHEHAKTLTKQEPPVTSATTDPVAPFHRKPTPETVKPTVSDARTTTNDNDDDDGKPFPCPDCAKQFKRSEHLKRHIRSVHSNIRPFHCKYCEKKFSRSDNLAQHLKTHYKVHTNGTTTIIYGNPNLHNRGGRKKNSD